ncbi:hypothetical protein CBS101457_002031 [Exobasidium rhododendri]|nr:hypothetical protein CBS101457_002031 [Exobasidium rhododendri]
MAGEDVAVALPALEASQVFATLLASYDSFKPDVAQLGRAGHPAFYERSATPGSGNGNGDDSGEDDADDEVQPASPTGFTSKIPFFGTKKRRNSKVKIARKRLQVQFPRKVLLDTRAIIRQPPIKSAEDLRLARGKPGRKYVTVFDSERVELVGIREKEPLCRVVSLLFNGNYKNDPRLFYPSESIVSGTKWSSKYRADTVTAPVKWATLSVLTPPDDGKKDNSVSPENEKEYLKLLGSTILDDEAILERQLFEPGQEAQRKLDEILDHLSRRGCIWTRAGHRSRASLRNPDPKQRPEFMIQGIFTEAFIDRCKRFQTNDNLPMPADLDEKKDKERPLITSLRGISVGEVEALDNESKLAAVDALQGCSVRVSVEPFRGAGFFEDLSASGGIAGT